MEIQYLEEFVALAEHLSFSETALHLNTTQSTLSKHIRALETELGGALFKRSTRRMELSAFGGFYLPYAEEISRLYETASLKTKAYLSEGGSAFTLAALRNSQYFDIARHIIGFRAACPECRIHVVEGEERELYSLFRQRQIKLFTAYVFSGEALEYKFLPLGESQVVALLPEEHRLSGCYALSLEQLKRENLLLPYRESKLFRVLMTAFAEAGVSPHVVYEGSSPGCMELVKSGMGVSLLPKELLSAQPVRGLCSVELKPPLAFRYGLGYREADLSVCEQKLLDYLKRFSLAEQ